MEVPSADAGLPVSHGVRKCNTILTVRFWQNGFFSRERNFLQIFCVEPPDFFEDFVAGFCLLIFVKKKCPEKSSRKIARNILQNLHNKNPQQLSAEGPGGQRFATKLFRSQKGLSKPKHRTNSTKESLEQFEGVTGHDPVR